MRLLIFFLAVSLQGQAIFRAQNTGAAIPPPAGVIDHQKSSNAATMTFPALTITGAEIIFVNIGYFITGTPTPPTVPTDTCSNTYVLASKSQTIIGNIGGSALYYVANPTICGATTVITSACTSCFQSGEAASFNKVATASPLDNAGAAGPTANNLAGGAGQYNAGPVVPNQNGSLIITTAGGDTTTTTFAVDSGFTILDQVPFTGGTNFGSAMAYFVQGLAASIDPNWAGSTTIVNGLSANNAVFKPGP